MRPNTTGPAPSTVASRSGIKGATICDESSFRKLTQPSTTTEVGSLALAALITLNGRLLSRVFHGKRSQSWHQTPESMRRSCCIIPTIVGRTIVGFVVACLYEIKGNRGEELTHLEKAERAFSGGIGVSGRDQSELCWAD